METKFLVVINAKTLDNVLNLAPGQPIAENIGYSHLEMDTLK